MSNKCFYYTEQQLELNASNFKGISIIHFNCRSMKSSYSDINSFMLETSNSFDIICISESWLTSQDNLHEYCINNYEVVNMNRKNKRIGGVIIYISKYLRY